MTFSRPSPWDSVTLYGVEHSPWVQGVLLALAHHQIPTQLTSYPLGVHWFRRNGLIFPALRLSDGTTHLDSFHIYARLEADGYPLGVNNFTAAERLHEQVALEALFGRYVLGRCGPGKQWRFIQSWSTMREVPHTVMGTVFRAFITHYYWVLIRLGVRRATKKGRLPFDPDAFERELRTWDARLQKQRWLTGPEIGFLDFALFGHLQCMLSGLTDEVIPILRQQPHLMQWLHHSCCHQSDQDLPVGRHCHHLHHHHHHHRHHHHYNHHRHRVK